MKEVFTKSFWAGVKATFEEAREGPPRAEKALDIPAGTGPGADDTIRTGARSTDLPSSPASRE
jgi:hypothetical protein